MRGVLHIGRLRDRVALSRVVLADDGKGGQLATLTPLQGPARVPAEVTPLRSEERLRAGVSESGLTHRVVLRYHPEVAADTRVTWDGRRLEVVGAPIVHGHRQWLECLCQERTA